VEDGELGLEAVVRRGRERGSGRVGARGRRARVEESCSAPGEVVGCRCWKGSSCSAVLCRVRERVLGAQVGDELGVAAVEACERIPVQLGVQGRWKEERLGRTKEVAAKESALGREGRELVGEGEEREREGVAAAQEGGEGAA